MAEGKTQELVVHHELEDVTPEMIDWWWDNIDTTERYNLWHPESHHSFEWEATEGEGHTGKTHRVTETIGDQEMTLRIRWVEPDSLGVERIYAHANAGCVLDDDDNPISWVLHEYEATDRGTKMRSTFILPAAAPAPFVDDLRRHNQEEMGRFPEFLPGLFSTYGPRS